jgi:hypothetical protein
MRTRGVALLRKFAIPSRPFQTASGNSVRPQSAFHPVTTPSHPLLLTTPEQTLKLRVQFEKFAEQNFCHGGYIFVIELLLAGRNHVTDIKTLT